MKKIILCIALACTMLTAQAQWTRNQSVGGGQASSLLKVANSVFALSSSAEVFQSLNGANNWNYKGCVTGMNGSFSQGGGTLFSNDAVLYKLDYRELLKSSNNGIDWEKILIDTTNNFRNISAADIFNGVLYAVDDALSGEDNKVYSSTDNGSIFTQITNIIPGRYFAKTLNSNLYLFSDSVIYVTSNGTTFTTVPRTGLPEDESLFLTEQYIGDGTTIYTIKADFTAGIPKSDLYKFNGTVWTMLNVGLPVDAYLYGLSFANNMLYVSTYSEATGEIALYKSINGGNNWDKLLGTGLRTAFAREIIAINANTLLGSFPDALYTSTDGGKTWSNTSNGFSATNHTGIVNQNNTIITFDSYTGASRSTDGGSTYTLANTGLPTQNTFFPSFAQTTDAIYIISTSGDGMIPELYKSTNNAQSWVKASLPTNLGNAFEITLSGVNNGSLFLRTYDSNTLQPVFYRSTNQGNTWENISANFPTFGRFDNLFSISGKANTLYTKVGEGIFRSTNNGTNWSLDTLGIRLSSTLSEVPYLGLMDNDIYTVAYSDSKNRLFKRGATKWELVNDFDYTFNIKKLARLGTNMYCIEEGGNGIRVSSNNGLNFVDYNEGFSCTAISNCNDFIISNNMLIASTDRNGIWRNGQFTGSSATVDYITNNTDGLLIYPNPANSVLNIELSIAGANQFTTQLYDIQGKLLKTNTSNTAQQLIDISDIPTGMYICKITTTDKQFTSKVLVSR